MMKITYNKKRNVLFLYEVLVRKLTNAILNDEEEVKNKVLSILKECFKNSTLLSKELGCYKSLLLKETVDLRVAEKIIVESRKDYDLLDKEKLFVEQNNLIKKINKILGKSIYSVFVPNYRTLAAIYQIFNNKVLSTKNKVLLEEKLITGMIQKEGEEDKKSSFQVMNNLVIKKFLENFNSHYSKNLLDEQKKLLGNHIVYSLSDVEFKIYLNEEIGRLKNVLSESLLMEEIKNDSEMILKTNKVLNMLENYSKKELNVEMVGKLLKVQQLAREVQVDD